MNDKTGKPSSVVAIYPYEGQFYGRIIGTYNAEGILDDTMYKPKKEAPGVVGNPYYSGLDILWTTQENTNGTWKGFIIDPEKGKTYKAKVWKEDGNVIVRGEVFTFGRNVTWSPFDEKLFTKAFPKPDVSQFKPVIPKTEH